MEEPNINGKSTLRNCENIFNITLMMKNLFNLDVIDTINHDSLGNRGAQVSLHKHPEHLF